MLLVSLPTFPALFSALLRCQQYKFGMPCANLQRKDKSQSSRVCCQPKPNAPEPKPNAPDQYVMRVTPVLVNV